MKVPNSESLSATQPPSSKLVPHLPFTLSLVAIHLPLPPPKQPKKSRSLISFAHLSASNLQSIVVHSMPPTVPQRGGPGGLKRPGVGVGQKRPGVAGKTVMKTGAKRHRSVPPLIPVRRAHGVADILWNHLIERSSKIVSAVSPSLRSGTCGLLVGVGFRPQPRRVVF